MSWGGRDYRDHPRNGRAKRDYTVLTLVEITVLRRVAAKDKHRVIAKAAGLGERTVSSLLYTLRQRFVPGGTNDDLLAHPDIARQIKE